MNANADELTDEVVSADPAYTPQQRCEDTLYFALSCVRGARVAMMSFERDNALVMPDDWYSERDKLRIALDSARRYRDRMQQNGWPIPALLATMLQVEGL